jgi:hypothetical protein
MTVLVRQQRHFLKLLVGTTPGQRKALLKTITRNQVKAVCQIAYNILRFTIQLTPSEKAKLKRRRSFIYLLGSKKVGYLEKKKAIENDWTTVYSIVKIASMYLGSVLQ